MRLQAPDHTTSNYEETVSLLLNIQWTTDQILMGAETSLDFSGTPAADFRGLPSTKVLTLHMDVPEAWLVEPVRAAYDLDNLRLSDLEDENTLSAEFELEAILLTGRCTDIAARRHQQVQSSLLERDTAVA